MNITNLELINFRNYDKCKINNFQNINIIIGKNGIGKTTILESLYFGSLTKTFKSNIDNILIKENEKFLKVKINLLNNDRKEKLEVTLNSFGKKTKINGNLKKRLSDYIFKYKIILFSPDELKIIKDPPNIRRNYLNIQLSQLNKNYIKLLNSYNILIKNKNDYLKKIYLNSNLDMNYLDVLDYKISQIGIEISNLRKNYINDINKIICKKLKKFRKSDELYMNYISDFKDMTHETAIKLLKKNRKKEIILGITSTGIHRDEIEFIHNNRNAKEYSSQGMQKLIILSLKLAELDIFTNKYYEIPILLLDDIFSELDLENQNKVIEILNKKIQTFITTTNLENINKKILKNAKIIELKENVKTYE
jgi:DNA replication and repair protein RecF